MKKGWTYKKFVDCINKIPKQRQVKSKDYLSSGLYPIVSQEKELISGYWNDKDYLFKHDKPIIIFGDHTKEIKYIDFDFVVGADGTQILQPKDDIDSRFFYYALLATPIRSLGYARHFKLLKEKSFLIPKLTEQKKIVKRLDAAFAQIDELKANAEKQLAEARALFQKALAKAMEPKERWEVKTLKEITTKIGSGATPLGGRKVYIREGISLVRSMNVHYNSFKYDELAHINAEAADQLSGVELKQNDVLFNITGASIARCCVLPDEVMPARVNQHVAIIRPITESVTPQFLCLCLISSDYQKELLQIGEAGSTRQALTKADLENFKISLPSLSEQQRIVERLDSISENVRKYEEIQQKIIAECDALKQALLRQVFE